MPIDSLLDTSTNSPSEPDEPAPDGLTYWMLEVSYATSVFRELYQDKEDLDYVLERLAYNATRGHYLFDPAQHGVSPLTLFQAMYPVAISQVRVYPRGYRIMAALAQTFGED